LAKYVRLLLILLVMCVPVLLLKLLNAVTSLPSYTVFIGSK